MLPEGKGEMGIHVANGWEGVGLGTGVVVGDGLTEDVGVGVGLEVNVGVGVGVPDVQGVPFGTHRSEHWLQPVGQSPGRQLRTPKRVAVVLVPILPRLDQLLSTSLTYTIPLASPLATTNDWGWIGFRLNKAKSLSELVFPTWPADIQRLSVL